MKALLKIAEKIKDEKLKKKVIDLLRKPRLTHKDFKKYPAMSIEKAKTLFRVGQEMVVERDILNHTIVLVEVCQKVANSIEKNYGIEINLDHLLAAAILHDVMKIFEWKEGPSGIEPTGIKLDHTMLAVAELYRRGFPEEVIHAVATHFGQGPTPPQTFEALILHYLDSLLSLVEYNLHARTKPIPQIPLILVDERTLKKIKEK